MSPGPFTYLWRLPTTRTRVSFRFPRSGQWRRSWPQFVLGAAFGVKTFFARSPDWRLLQSGQGAKPEVLERSVFMHRTGNVYLIADAYRGSAIKQAVLDFLDAAAGAASGTVSARSGSQTWTLNAQGTPNLVVYVGHDGLMDFQLSSFPARKDQTSRQAIILACASKAYFAAPLRASGAYPLLWTTGLMAPEAYTLKGALDGWILRESDEQIRDRAAAAYHQYQNCSMHAARGLFASGW